MASNVREDARIPGSDLAPSALGALLILIALLYLVAFDHGQLASLVTTRFLEAGGALHEFFHDARHLLGIPCH